MVGVSVDKAQRIIEQTLSRALDQHLLTSNQIAQVIIRDLGQHFDLETLTARPHGQFYDENRDPKFHTEKPEDGVVMQPWHLAWILHWQAGTLSQVAFHPRGCRLCEQAVELYDDIFPKKT